MFTTASLFFIAIAGLLPCSEPNPAPQFGKYAELLVEKNPDGTVNVTHDCLLYNKKEYKTSIWSPSYPHNLVALTIQNCERVALDPTVPDTVTNRNLTHLIVKNVDKCVIVGSPTEEPNELHWTRTWFPCHTVFTNLESLEMKVPLYGDIVDEWRFQGGVLRFENVGIRDLPEGGIRLGGSSLRRLTLDRVRVGDVHGRAIAFTGYGNSLLEIKNSVFRSVPDKFVTCNVTNVIISGNTFDSFSRETFALETENLDFTGNIIGKKDNNKIAISLAQAQQVFDREFTENDVVENVFAPKLSNVEKINSHEFVIGNEIFRANSDVCSPHPKDTSYAGGSLEKGTHAERCNTNRAHPSSMFRMSNNLLLLWLFSVCALILLFPMAYFLKIYLGKAINYVFQLDMRHKRLENIEEM